jgi:hypothetical protein
VRPSARRLAPAIGGTVAFLALGVGPTATAAEAPLPLPPAPVRLVVPDVPAFDAALTGSFRRALTGAPAEGDPLTAAWRRTPVGTKLEAQWALLAQDLPWTWTEILRTKPRSLGLALLSAGELEAVLVLDTALAALPLDPPGGTTKSHAGTPYTVVARGARDGRLDDRRLGLAWARRGTHLVLATSERALLLVLDEAAASRGVAAFLPGLASLALDTDALSRDPYFRREFLFEEGERGRVLAALRAEGGSFVEVREGAGAPGGPAFLFEAPNAAAAGWETDGARLFTALRTGLLEAIPEPAARPVPPLLALPEPRAAALDRYLVDLRKPARGPEAKWEEGELAALRSLVAKQSGDGWGFAVLAGGERALALPWPAAEQAELERSLRKTLERRAGPTSVTTAGDVREIRVGPGLVALALRRAGDFVWIGSSSRALSGLGTPRPAAPTVRWARVDLGAARAESDRWARAEGPAAPERVRPFSDRVLGLLGWIPGTRSIAVERLRTETGWSERVVFGTQ